MRTDGAITNVVVFCGAHAPEKYLALAYQLGSKLARNGFTVVTGGGTGMMAEVTRGAFDSGGQTVGMMLKKPNQPSLLPHHQYIQSKRHYRVFTNRHRALIAMGDAFIVLPGGLGSILEAVEITQLKKFKSIKVSTPLIFLTDYYQPLVELFKTYKQEGFISEKLEELYSFADNPDEAVTILTA